MTEEYQKLGLAKRNMVARIWSNKPQYWGHSLPLDRRLQEEVARARAAIHWPGIDTGAKSIWINTGTKSRTKPQNLLLLDRQLQEEVARARAAILSLQDNWDKQGSPGYAESTMDRAIRFLDIHVKQVFDDSRRILIPRILPSDGGSIDLHWRTQEYELLVNVPATDDVAVSFYGEVLLGRSCIKGTFDRLRESKVLAKWLTEASA